MTKNFNFALKIKGGGKEGGTCEVLRPCHPPKKNFGMCTEAKNFTPKYRQISSRTPKTIRQRL